MRARPKTGGIIVINGDAGYVALHPNQKWETKVTNDGIQIEYKFLTLILEKKLFDKMFMYCE